MTISQIDLQKQVKGTLPAANEGPITGDVSKSAGSSTATVTGIQSTVVNSTPPALDQILQFDGSQWAPAYLAAVGNGTLFLDVAASPIGGGYLSLIESFPSVAENTSAASGSGVGVQTLVAAFASSALSAITIPMGMWTPSIYVSVDSLTQSPEMVLKVYTRTAAGAETLQGTWTSILTATATTLYTPTIELGNIAVNPTDLVVLKVYLQTGGASSRTMTIYYDGSTHVSHLHMPVSAINVVRSEFVNAQTGTTYTVSDSDRGKLVTFSNTSAVAVTLPTPTSTLFVNGWFCDVQNNNKGLVTITPTAATINGLSSISLLKGQGFRIASDGTNYQIVGEYISGTPSNTWVPTYNSTNGDVEWAAPSGGGGVTSLNALTGALSLTSTGSTITITPSGSTINLESTGSASPTLSTATISGTVAGGASATGTVAMAKAFMLLGINAGNPVRLRMYSTAAARTADAARSNLYPTTPGTQNGVICDMYLDTSDKYTNWMCSPAIFGFNWDGTPPGSTQVTSIYYSITNITGGSLTYSIDLKFVQMES